MKLGGFAAAGGAGWAGQLRGSRRRRMGPGSSQTIGQRLATLNAWQDSFPHYKGLPVNPCISQEVLNELDLPLLQKNYPAPAKFIKAGAEPGISI